MCVWTLVEPGDFPEERGSASTQTRSPPLADQPRSVTALHSANLRHFASYFPSPTAKNQRTPLVLRPHELVVTVATEFGTLSDETHALIKRAARLAESQRSWPRELFAAHFTKAIIFEHVRACASTLRNAAAAFRGELVGRWNASTAIVRLSADAADARVLSNLDDAALLYAPNEANSRAF